MDRARIVGRAHEGMGSLFVAPASEGAADSPHEGWEDSLGPLCHDRTVVASNPPKSGI